uniref:threonine/serine ThrE exporter family protein n=1 Tax=Ndongobacter massiliensis TaxID=1871025 RepID=UPI0009303FE0|nr:threonine/serine exporter family protein [Ndongobacter massiliensis]
MNKKPCAPVPNAQKIETSQFELAEAWPSKAHRIMDVAVLAGAILAQSGAETYRVEDTMERILRLEPNREVDVVSLMTGLYVTRTEEDGSYISVVHRIRRRAIDLGKIDEVNRISRNLANGACTIEEGYRALRAVELRPQQQKRMELLEIVAGVAFAVMLGSGWLETLFAIPAAMALIASQRLLRSAVLGNFVPTFFQSLFTTFLIGLSARLVPDIDPQRLTSAVLMILFPGTTLTSGIRDMIRGDYLAGGGNLLHALVTSSALAIGAGAGFFLGGGYHGL